MRDRHIRTIDQERDALIQLSSSRIWPVWVSLLAALLGGLGAGVVAKLADQSSIPGIGNIGTYLGVWVLLVTMIAAWSRSWQRAWVCAVTFLLAMVTAYYVIQMRLFGFFSTNLLLAWGAIGLFLVPPFAALVWHARRTGWLAVLGAAVPIGLLLAEAYSVRFQLRNPFNDNYKVQFVFDIMAAVALLLILPRNGVQRVRVLLLIPIIVFSAPVVLDYIWGLIGRFM